MKRGHGHRAPMVLNGRLRPRLGVLVSYRTPKAYKSAPFRPISVSADTRQRQPHFPSAGGHDCRGGAVARKICVAAPIARMASSVYALVARHPHRPCRWRTRPPSPAVASDPTPRASCVRISCSAATNPACGKPNDAQPNRAVVFIMRTCPLVSWPSCWSPGSETSITLPIAVLCAGICTPVEVILILFIILFFVGPFLGGSENDGPRQQPPSNQDWSGNEMPSRKPRVRRQPRPRR